MISPRPAHHLHGPFSGRFREWSGVWSGVFHPGPGLGPGSLLNDSNRFRGFRGFSASIALQSSARTEQAKGSQSHCHCGGGHFAGAGRAIVSSVGAVPRAGAMVAAAVSGHPCGERDRREPGPTSAKARRIAGSETIEAVLCGSPRTSLYMISAKKPRHPGTP